MHFEVFDGTLQRIRNRAKLHRFVKWVSRVCIVQRPVRMALKNKLHNSSTTPSPPPLMPRPPDHLVHHMYPCSSRQPPAPPRPLDPLRHWVSDYTHDTWCLDSHTAHATQLSSEQQKHGDSYIVENPLGSLNFYGIEEPKLLMECNQDILLAAYHVWQSSIMKEKWVQSSI